MTINGTSRSASKARAHHPLSTALVFSNVPDECGPARVRLSSLKRTVPGAASVPYNHGGNAWGSASSLTSVSDNSSDKTPPPRLKPSVWRRTLTRVEDVLRASSVYHALLTSIAAIASVCVIVYLLIDSKLLGVTPASHRLLHNTLYFIIMPLLSLLLIDLAVKLMLWRTRLCQQRMELVDAVLLAVTTAAMILSRTVDTSEPANINTMAVKYCALLVCLRCWRVVRVLNGLIERVRADAEHRIGRERRARRALHREVTKLREYCVQQECEMQMYRMMLAGTQPTTTAATSRMPPPPTHPFVHCGGRTLHVIAEVNDMHSNYGGPTSGSGTPSPSDHCIAGTSAATGGAAQPPPEYTETDMLATVTTPSPPPM